MEYKYINESVIRQSLMNNNEMIKQFIDLYLLQCPIDFETLLDSIQKQDLEAIGSAAHHIKPTMAYIGSTELHINFQELEKLGRQNASMTEVLQKFEEIKPKFAQMLEELKIFNK